MISVLPVILTRSRGGRYVDQLHLKGMLSLAVSKIDLRHLSDNTDGSFRVRSTNFLLNLRVTPPISMKFGTLADNA